MILIRSKKSKQIRTLKPFGTLVGMNVLDVKIKICKITKRLKKKIKIKQLQKIST